jgi:hypothetical protein
MRKAALVAFEIMHGYNASGKAGTVSAGREKQSVP